MYPVELIVFHPKYQNFRLVTRGENGRVVFTKLPAAVGKRYESNNDECDASLKLFKVHGRLIGCEFTPHDIPSSALRHTDRHLGPEFPQELSNLTDYDAVAGFLMDQFEEIADLKNSPLTIYVIW